MVIKVGSENLYDLIGGRPTLDKVHKIFYDKIYTDPWIGLYFLEIKQEHIESQQSDFMAQAMGGPAMYMGAIPIPAHKHMFISEELFELRTRFLKEALNEGLVPVEYQELWLKIDQAFKKGIVKKELSDCSLRYKTDQILNFPNPFKKAG